MEKFLKFIICFSLLLAGGVFAEDRENFKGSFDAIGVQTETSGNEAKFNEYRDLKDGVYSRLKLVLDSDKYFMKFNAEDIGFGTQSYNFEGGSFARFKTYFKYNEIPHNFTYDARTFYDGAGTDKLTANSYFVLNNPDTYTPTNLFDYSIQRKQVEGGFKLDALKPFYFDISFSREGKDGIKPNSAPLTTGGGSYFVELPEPVDYTTNNFKAEWGFAKNPFFFSLAYFHSQFSNEYPYLFFSNVYNANTFNAPKMDYLTLPPDNKFNNFSFKGTAKLPFKSVLNVKFARTKGTSKYNLFDYYVRNVTGGIQNVTLSDLKFDGKINTTDYDITLTTNPFNFLFAKVYYKDYDKNNDSDEITHTDPNVNGKNPFETELFGYEKKKSGIELDFKLPAKLSLITSYSQIKTIRERSDLPETRDFIYTLEMKWRGLDLVTARFGYERLNRGADHHILETLFETDQALANVVEKYLFRFDGAPMERDSYKASIEIYPLDNINIIFNFKDKKSNYINTILGLKEDKRKEYGIDFDWNISRYANILFFGAFEETRFPQFQRYSTPNGSLDPNFPGTSDSYNWHLLSKNKTYNYGGGAELIAIPEKLQFSLSYDYIKSDGLFDFTFFDYTPAQNNDIPNVDDYVRKLFVFKASYSINKRFSFIANYIYEKYNYSDIAFDGYMFTYNGGNDTSITSLTGAYMAPSYDGKVAYLGVSYKF